ncbi:HNH endonuclease signature motif containing protein [Agromyces sp. LHK192]|uniref:HNH endonuclease signature motif containing protein n=1 Tax=Agromyces sp. LHK192 TaxID=2498704 RepID=UPI000FDA3761|nr:HNH endonuclease signature motif containing protein [Agromyces sp. LHK192]
MPEVAVTTLDPPVGAHVRPGAVRVQQAGRLDDRSDYARAADTLSDLVDAAAAALCIEAMHAAVQVQLLRLAMDHAVAASDAFTSPRLSSERRRDLAIRAVIAEFATAMRLPERTVQRLASDAWVLTTRLPATFRAMSRGAFALAHARVIIEAVDGVDDDSIAAELDTALAELAATVTVAKLRRDARRSREALLAETAAERHRHAAAERRVELEPARDGMAWLHLHLPAADALLAHDRIDRTARSLLEPGDEPRTLDQTRADVARDLLLGAPMGAVPGPISPVPISPTVAVTVPVLTLLGGDQPGHLDGYGPIDPDTARRLAAHAPSFTRILTHPVTGTVLDVDRTSYRPPADLIRWVRLRDETCRFPGCNRAARTCDLDHTHDWADGGTTTHDNLALLCPHHHHLKHETSWTVRRATDDGYGAGGDYDGALEWRSPTGRRHRTHPAVRRSVRHGDTGHGVPPGPPRDMETPTPASPHHHDHARPPF